MEVVDLLLKAGADKDKATDKGMTPFLVARLGPWMYAIACAWVWSLQPSL